MCLGFFRDRLGSMGREEGTVPTRSRASLRTTCPASNLGFFRATGLIVLSAGPGLDESLAAVFYETNACATRVAN